jgi:2-oxoglutarate dehydrogenase E1 component
MSETSLFYGPNAAFVQELYDRYRQDPNTVDDATRAFFEAWTPPTEVGEPAAPPPETSAFTALDVERIAAAARLARLIRQRGHLAAHVDPIDVQPKLDPALELSQHGLTTEYLATLPASVVGGPLAAESKNALEAFGKLRRIYSGSIGYDDEHIQDAEERYWLRDGAESGRFFEEMDAEAKRDLLERLTEVECFEQFIHKNMEPGAKRFSIEGTDTLVPMLDEIIGKAAAAGNHEVVLGMAHRGRLNVLAHILGKPYAAIFSEFDAARREEGASVSGRGSQGWTGDVKYHLGHRRAYNGSGVGEMPITLVPNPSHLEFVNPVVEGHARAAQERRSHRGEPDQDDKASLPILIHGDASFPAQGVVAETLNLSRLNGYRTDGTIHIIVNNQIGFTTLPSDARSTMYASDLAKGFEIPIVHVNADDPIACIAATHMALAYRERFHKDFLIDLIGYRRYGHNEGDQPAYTQPEMYRLIETHPTVRELWARELERQGIVTRDEATEMVHKVMERLQAARNAPNAERPDEEKMYGRTVRTRPMETAVPAAKLSEYSAQLLQRPEGFTVNAQLERTVFTRRRAAFTEQGRIDWGHAEELAFASVLADGTPIRLTGQDSERGTFAQRHAVLHDPTSGTRCVPLQQMPAARASFAVYNSALSENACLGFEYGYSMHAPGVLVLWEAQFGDFTNGAQVIIDQFLASGNAKWRQIPSLVLLLPHGYEGQGPEHSSARLERYLQLCAGDNMRVVNPTTAAQYFHLLRRQAAHLEIDPRPLIVMTPKSLLRNVNAASTLSELTQGTFQPVMDDLFARDRARKVTRLILCSGKIYMDLVYESAARPDLRPAFADAGTIAAVRVEELYPFPAEALHAVIAGYPNLREIVWMQEEPRNMGAWSFIAPRLRDQVGWQESLIYIGRNEAASPAEGSLRRHIAEQNRIITDALQVEPERPPLAERETIAA